MAVYKFNRNLPEKYSFTVNESALDVRRVYKITSRWQIAGMKSCSIAVENGK